MTGEQIASALGGRPAGDGFTCHCPAHEDSSASLTVHDRDGKILVHCKAGCSQVAVIDALRGRGLWPAGVNGNGGGNGSGRREVCRYDYTDADGNLLYQVVRFDPKGFRQFDAVRKVWNLKEVERVPYRLPEVLQAIKDGKGIFLVEGERDVDNLRALGLVATTNQGGTGSKSLWRKFAKKYFHADVRVYEIPDADDPGQQLMAEAAQDLQAAGCIVKKIDLGYAITANHGKDVSDWIAEGHTREELIALAEKAGPWEMAFGEQAPIADGAGSIPVSRAPLDVDGDQPESLVKDYGHASVLAPHFLNLYRWATHRKCWMHNTGVTWIVASDELVSKIAADTLRKQYTTELKVATVRADVARLTSLLREICVYQRLQGALSFLKGWPGIHTSPEEWDRDNWALNVKNADGVIDLRTGGLRPRRVDDLFTRVAPVFFDPSAKGPHWEAHLDWFLPNREIRRHVQRSLGLSLVGVTLREALDIWIGGGGNAKTTTARVFMIILGAYTKRAAPNLLIQGKYERHPTELADLAGIRIVFSIEIDKAKKLAEALVKELVGGDVKKARFMRCDFFEFAQTFSITLLVNHEPVITGTDEGIWRRIFLVPWNQTIPEEKKRPQEDVVEELASDGSAVLNWLLEGLKDWQADRKWIAPDVRAATQKYRKAQDRLGPFIADECEEGRHHTVTVADLYKSYQAWCEEAGEEAEKKVDFNSLLHDKGMVSKREGKDRAWTWTGLRLGRRTQADADSHIPHASDFSNDDMESTSANVRQNKKTSPISLLELDLLGSGVSAEAGAPGAPEIPKNLSNLTLADLEAKALEISAFIDSDPPHPELMPELERLGAAISARQGAPV